MGKWASWRQALIVTEADMFPEVSDEGQRLQLKRQALDLLVDGARISLTFSYVALVLVALLLWPRLGPARAMGPALLLVLWNLDRGLLLRRMARDRAQGGDDEPGRWGRALGWRVAVNALIVAFWSLLVIASGDAELTFWVLALVVTLSAGAMTQFCCWPPVMWANLAVLPPAVALQLVLLGGPHYAVNALFLVLLCLALGSTGVRFARALHSDMATRQRNEALVAELQVKRQQAEAASRAKSRFLAAASHDLRQPAHAVVLLNDALQQRLAGGPHAALGAQLGAGLASFSELIDEVMDAASIDLDELHEVRAAPVPAATLLARAEATFRPSAEARGLALWLRLPAGGAAPVLRADPALLWRVLSNLLSNALRYTPVRPGGDGVMVAVRRARAAQGAPAWRIEVRDNGPGVPAAQRELIFEEFQQAHGPHHGRAHGQGFGLGLAVARRMARLMGSEVRLHPASASGTGAVFSITLPALAAGARTTAALAPLAAPSQPGRRASLRGLRLIVVDDDPAACRALLALLQGWDVQAQATADAQGAEALAGAAARDGQPPHALLTDHWLAGGQDSGDVLRAVLPHAPELRIAVVSGGAQPEEVAALERPGSVFLRKPLRPQALHHWLAQCLPPCAPGAARRAAS